ARPAPGPATAHGSPAGASPAPDGAAGGCPRRPAGAAPAPPAGSTSRPPPRRPRPRTVRPPAPGAGPAQFPDDSYAYLLAHPVQGGRADPGDLQQILHRLERAVLATPLDEVLCLCGADPGQRLQFLGRGRIQVLHGLLV